MSGTPDLLTHLGGAPVGGRGQYAGWWGNDVWYVDYDNGKRAGQRGKNDMDAPQKDIYQSITDATAGDTIYVRSRTTVPSVGSNNECIEPAATEAANWTIAQTQHHLSIIGTENCGDKTHGVMFRGYAGVAGTTFLVLAPYVTFENIGIKGIEATQTAALLHVKAYTPGTHDGFACTVDNCTFQVYHGTGGGAVLLDSGRYNRVIHSTFWHNRFAIYMSSSAKTIQGNTVHDCDFEGMASDVKCDIQIADANHIRLSHNRFHHEIPTAGAPNLYVNCTATANGWMFRCDFGDEGSLKMDELCSLSNIVDVACTSGYDGTWCTAT